jgi:hypothetical protein
MHGRICRSGGVLGVADVLYQKQEFPPLLGEGFHQMSLADMEDLCVVRFPLSTTRADIMAGLELIVKQITAVRL